MVGVEVRPIASVTLSDGRGPAERALTRELLRWQPVQPGLIEDLDKGHYFG